MLSTKQRNHIFLTALLDKIFISHYGRRKSQLQLGNFSSFPVFLQLIILSDVLHRQSL